MRKMGLIIVVIAAVVLLAMCRGGPSKVVVPPSAAAETKLTVAQGELIGFTAENGVHVWRGVPFAEDTSGKNRWRAPRPAPNWSGTREALEFAPVCPQIATPFTPIEGFTNWTLEGSEDCLMMDIYTPPNAKGRSLPVMMWIHGGSNVSGASQLYVGENLALNEDVIVMSVQYRLGPMGWFSHPALVESAQTPEDKAANFGTLDLIAALKWIQTNADAFGGDPDNVTIFGESAGGHNVATLLASPLAKGLFHKAIIQSGGFDSITIDEARGNAGDLPNTSLAVTERLGGAEKFHTASLDEVFEAYERDGGMFLDLPKVIQDGVVLPATSLRQAFASTDTFNAVPIISGVNRDEMKLFYLFDDRLTKQKFGRFPVARDQDVYDAASDYSSRGWRIRSVDRPLAMMTEAGHDQVYGYQFDWDEGGKLFWTDFSKMMGAGHSLEIPFVLNRFDFFGRMDSVLFKKKTAASREKISRSMGAYWAEFARTGTPGSTGGTDWAVFGDAATVMHFDSDKDGGIRLETGPDTAAKLAAELKADGRINAGVRCEIAQNVANWMKDFAAILGPLENCEL